MKDLDILIEDLKTLFNKRLVTVLVFGSKANSGLENVKSNVDLMIILSKFNSQDLKRLQPVASKWIKAGNPYPIIIGAEELAEMSPVYAIEYADIKWNFQIVYGKDIFQNVYVNYDELKAQVIRELTYLLMKFRGCYLEYGKNKHQMKNAFLKLIDSCLVIFRSILRLQQITPSVYKNDLIEQISDLTRVDKVLFKRLLAYKEKTSDLPDYILDDGVMLVINQLTTLLQQVRLM